MKQIRVPEIGNIMAVQWLEFPVLSDEGPDSVPGQGTKISQAKRYSRKKKKKNTRNNS